MKITRVKSRRVLTMDGQNLVPDVIFLENLDSEINLSYSNKDEVSSEYSEYNLKENYPNINNQIRLNSTNVSVDQIQKKNVNSKYNIFQVAGQDENSNSENSALQNSENEIFNCTSSSFIEEENTSPGFRNFKLEWDKENDALYIVIPSVDSLDHWMMLFLQPLGITNESLCLENCCVQNKCDFRIRLDDERLLLYPDLLKDISDFLSIQIKKWQFYKSNVMLRDMNIDNQLFGNEEIQHQVSENCIYNFHDCSKLPNINVFLNNSFQKEKLARISEYNDSDQFYERKPNQENVEFDNNSQNNFVLDDHMEIYRKSIMISELCSQNDEPISVSSKFPFSRLTTNISESNLVVSSDSTMLPVLTSENSSQDGSYFTISSSINNPTTNEKEYFPI